MSVVVSGRSVASGFLLNIIIKIVAAGLGLYQLHWLYEHSNVANLADYNVANAYLGPLALLMGLGITNTLQKFFTNDLVSKSDSDKANFWTSIWYLRGATLIIGFVLLILLAYFKPDISWSLWIR